MTVLSARGVSKSYGGKVLFSDLSITLRRKERVGLIGLNGAGKSTLLRVLAGLDQPDVGTIDVRRDARILYLSQEPVLPPESTPRAVVTEAIAAWHKATERYAEVSHLLDQEGADHDVLLDEQATLAELIEHLGGWERGHQVDDILGKLGVANPDVLIGTMSGGERRRVALAQLLVSAPDVAILDEPTNHLDTATIEWLEEYFVNTFEGAVFVVTHDRAVLDRISERIVELDRGILTSYEGNYADYLDKKAESLAQAQRVEDNRQNFVRREQAWLRRGAKARSTKQKARIQRAEAAISVQAPKAAARATLEAAALKTGKTILELRAAALSIGERKLFNPLTLYMVSGDRIGIVGPNGAGKTSLLKLVNKEWTPSEGEVVLGVQTKIAYFDQARADLHDDWTVFDNVAGFEGAERNGGGFVSLGGEMISLRRYLENFLFDPSAQRQQASSLSGGERARLALAKLLKGGANLLLLDEPTNDLDVMMLGALEEMLETWSGCALVVSHDRAFLNNVATSILAFEDAGGDGFTLVHYPGNYDQYRALRAEAAKLAAAPTNAKKNSNAPGGSREGGKRTSTAPAASEAPAGKKGLTAAERNELSKILDQIQTAEAAVLAAEAELSDPALYQQGTERTRTLHAALVQAQTKLATLTARWEVLESNRD